MHAFIDQKATDPHSYDDASKASVKEVATTYGHICNRVLSNLLYEDFQLTCKNLKHGFINSVATPLLRV